MLAAGRLDKPYTGIIDCFKRIYADEGAVAVSPLS
jgi:solute carrier family 25 (adenine nucleotide translocator) protein 4/5/6/31